MHAKSRRVVVLVNKLTVRVNLSLVSTSMETHLLRQRLGVQVARRMIPNPLAHVHVWKDGDQIPS